MVNIGRITSAVGIRGEVRVALYAGESDNLHEGSIVHLIAGKKDLECRVVSIRYQNNKPVIKLEGYNDRTAVELLRDYEVYIKDEDLEPLEEGQFYIKDLIGFNVYDKASNSVIGTVVDYIQNRAQAIWDIKSNEGKQILIPDVDAFVKNIDVDSKTIEVELIPGFLD